MFSLHQGKFYKNAEPISRVTFLCPVPSKAVALLGFLHSFHFWPFKATCSPRNWARQDLVSLWYAHNTNIGIRRTIKLAIWTSEACDWLATSLAFNLPLAQRPPVTLMRTTTKKWSGFSRWMRLSSILLRLNSPSSYSVWMYFEVTRQAHNNQREIVS